MSSKKKNVDEKKEEKKETLKEAKMMLVLIQYRYGMFASILLWW